MVQGTHPCERRTRRGVGSAVELGMFRIEWLDCRWSRA